uniref:Adhesion G protein-coupled receptor D2 n=1 Tax=Pelodiscus sinensis TaxID=13735 RepID=K7FDM2_PELSI
AAPATVAAAGEVYEFADVPLDWWHASKHCEQRFAQLLMAPGDGGLASLRKLLRARGVPGAVWLGEREAFLRKPKQRREKYPGSRDFWIGILALGGRSKSPDPPLAMFCRASPYLWPCSAPGSGLVHAVGEEVKETWARERGGTRSSFECFLGRNSHGPSPGVRKENGHKVREGAGQLPRHACRHGLSPPPVRKQRRKAPSAAGLCAAGPLASQAIYDRGTFIIGQDQDSLGGAFKEKESFSGNITGLFLWRRVLSEEQIERVRALWWDSFTLEIEPTVQEVTVQFLCPAPANSQCRVLDVGSGGLSYTSCLRALPFVCRYKKAPRHPGQDWAPWPGLATISNVSNFLSVLQALALALREEETPVEPADLLGVVQFLQQVSAVEVQRLEPAALLGVVRFLQQVSAVEVQERGELGLLEPLSRYYVEVTGLILEEQNTNTFSEISQIIRGPMAVVENTDRMASNLDQLLTGERTKLAIRHRNVGLRRVTVVNTWYSSASLQRLLPGAGVGFQDVAASDGGRNVPRYLRTQVGSAVISSALRSDYQEISTSVRYRLQHRSQVPGFLPVSLSRCGSPDTGGMWSTVGCSIISSHPGSTACFCNHTTNFAVLLQVYKVQRSSEEELTLKTLTFIGCGVSFCALIVTFVLFLAVGVPKSERTTVHKNLIFALAAAEALLMFSELAKTNQVLCFAVTAFLHLFFMAAFSWMLVEGLLLWRKCSFVTQHGPGSQLAVSLFSGLPVVIVGVTLATSFNEYVAEEHCWLNVQTDIIWAFVGPVLFVLTVNTFVLLLVVMVTVSSARRRSKMLSPRSSLEKQIGIQIWATAKPILVLLPVLGLTWVCGVLVHLSIVWAHLFIVLNSLQGLYIFLVYAVYNSEVRNAIQRMKEKKKA